MDPALLSAMPTGDCRPPAAEKSKASLPVLHRGRWCVGLYFHLLNSIPILHQAEWEWDVVCSLPAYAAYGVQVGLAVVSNIRLPPSHLYSSSLPPGTRPLAGKGKSCLVPMVTDTTSQRPFFLLLALPVQSGLCV